MAQDDHTVTGGCMCGAVRYEASGEPVSVIHCHCLSCRRHTGAPVVTLAGYRRGRVEWTAEARQTYKSSPDVDRGFCGKCGTPLTWEGDGGEEGPLIEILMSTTDDPDALMPQFHIHHDERIGWFEIADNLPRFHVWGDDGSKPYRHGPAINGPEA
jgi:hypothetical protein